MTRTVLWGARRHDIQLGSRQDQYRQRLLNGETPTDITIKIHIEGAKKFMAACMSAQEAMTALRKAANVGVSTKEMVRRHR